MWRSLAYNYREGGIRQILRKIPWRFRQWLWSETVWLVYRTELRDYQREPKLPLVRSELGLDALRENGYFKAIAFPEAIRVRLDAGERCNGFFRGAELVNVAWTTRGYLVLEAGGLSIRENNCVGIYDCYTLPAHRGKGIYTDTLVRLLRWAQNEGATTALIMVEPCNHTSIKGIERAGFVPQYRLIRRCRFGQQSLRRSEIQPLGGGTRPA